MNVRAVAVQAYVFMLAFGLFALGAVSLLDYFRQSTPSLHSVSLLPDSSLLAMSFGVMLVASGRKIPWLVYIAGSLSLAICLYTLSHNVLAGGSDHGVSLISGFVRTRSPLAMLVLVTAIVLMLALQERFAGVAKWLAYGLIALGLGQAIADIAGLFPAMPYGFKTSAALLASAAIVFIGLGLLALASLPRGGDFLLDRSTLLVGALSAVIAVGSWQAITLYEQKVAVRSVETTLKLLESTLERMLQARLNMVQRLGARLEAMNQLPGELLWNTDAEGYLRDFPYLQFLALVDDLGPVYSTTSNPRFAQPVQLMTSDSVIAAVIGKGDEVDPGPVLLGEQIGSDALMVMPLEGVFQGGKYALVAGMNLTAVIEDILSRGPVLGSVLVFRDGAQVYGPRGELLDSLMPVTQRAFVRSGSQWDVEIMLPRYSLASDSRHLATWMLGFILLFGFLLMLSYRLGVLTRQRNEELEATSGKLTDSLLQQQKLKSANQMIMQHSLDMLCAFDAQGRFTQVSHSCVDILGYTPEELIGTRFIDYVMPADTSETTHVERGLRSGGVTYDHRNRYIHKNGSVVYLMWSAVWSEEQAQTFSVARNVTHQRAVETKLEQHRKLFQIAGQSAKVGGWLINAQDGQVQLSEEVCAIHGAPYASIESLAHWCALFEPGDGQLLHGAIGRCMVAGEDFEIRLRTVPVRGHCLWVRINGHSIKGDDGEVDFVQGALQDVTSEVLASESLEHLAQQMQSILISITDAFYTLDSQWRFVYVNPQAERLLRRTADELVGRGVWTLFPEAADSAIHQNYHEAVASNETRRFEIYYPPFDSWFDITVYPADGGVTVYFRDVSQRKHSEQQAQQMLEELERSNRDLQDFAFVASHDLQEPLRKIQAFGERLELRSAQLDETAVDYLRRMRQAAGRMQTLIQDLLLYSRVTTRGAPIEAVALDDVLDEVLQDIETTVDANAALIMREPLAVVSGDAGQLRQLLQNLLTNAIKFQPEGQAPRIRVYGEQDGPGYWSLFVEDNGIGFDEKYLDRIFNPFQRLNDRTRYAGTGIGLAIVKRIAERHRATITAVSAPGEGTTFKIRFRLPILPAARSLIMDIPQ